MSKNLSHRMKKAIVKIGWVNSESEDDLKKGI